MSESTAIIQVLKRSLKSKGLTYKDIAKRVGLSEASVKRVFSAKTFTLQRLESVCMAIGMSMAELVRIASESHESGAGIADSRAGAGAGGRSEALRLFLPAAEWPQLARKSSRA